MKFFWSITLAAIFTLNLPGTTYYVDPVNGLDANNGLGPDASHASNKPWKTISKARTLSSGDTAYFAPGVYREAITLTNLWTSQVSWLGDPQNLQGFRDSSGVLVPPQICRWTGYTNSDTTIGSASNPLLLNAKNYLRLGNFYIQSSPNGGAAIKGTGPAGGTNIVLTNLVVIGTTLGYAVSLQTSNGVPANLTIDNCALYAMGGANSLSVIHTSGAGPDYDQNVVVRNTLMVSETTVFGASKSGSGAGVGGGFYVTNCTIIGPNGLVVGNTSTNTYKHILRNCYFLCGGGDVVIAQDTGQVDMDYCMLIGDATPLVNTSLGPNCHTNDWSFHTDLVSSQMFGFGLRPDWSPQSNSPWVGAGQANSLTIDLFGRTRPNPPSIGAIEVFPAPEHTY